jgi:hypothetical protein
MAAGQVDRISAGNRRLADSSLANKECQRRHAVIVASVFSGEVGVADCFILL